MRFSIRTIAAAFFLVAAASMNAQNRTDGFYKDIFMDSGIKLTSRVDLPAARFLGLQMEKFVSVETKADLGTYTTYLDTLLQNELMVGSALDENGCLLYPDGAPRYRVLYVNGGRAATHGRTLGPDGQERVRKFVKSGGSYVGTCAGMFVASLGTHSFVDTLPPKLYEGYFGVWPSLTVGSGLSRTPTGMFIEPGSALLNYYDFGGDMYIDSVYHNGGGFTMPQDMERTPGAEVLLRYDYEKKKMHNQISAWAWKENAATGRVVLCGSHPEGVTSGERLHLFSAFLKYAMDGNGAPKLKATLKMGEARKMDRCTHDNMPSYTRIGDRQYHHYTVEVPSGLDSLKISLKSVKGWADYDLYVAASYDGFAFLDKAEYEDISLGVDKVLAIPSPKPGKLYISVFCGTTVDAVETKYGTRYEGRVEVLNGVPYIIEVK
ncbi:MAG: hypothetical protein IKX03_06000 [Bacteroidales bacterium]|nr:hypothetical protein [Bacteroidales bacterium]